ncbi:MAG: fumarylacetoacetase [Limnohabitans sp.]|jgi:fumarylacetoacetase|nr:fumarylacetoacetase [Limnohabitans sp.]
MNVASSMLLSPNDPALRSWVESANDASGDFPLQNLPLGVVEDGPAVRIGERVLCLRDALDADLFVKKLASNDEFLMALDVGWLNGIAELDPLAQSMMRENIAAMLVHGSPVRTKVERLLRDANDCEPTAPFVVGDYTDFYASLSHATNVGSMFRPTNPLLPNWKHVPIGYHGRASSIVASGAPIRRPKGQTVASDDGPPTFGPSKLMDYELEVGFFVGRANELGDTIPVADAWNRIFGFVLVNDWSARDIQKWEYQPLGPFLAKNFATTVSPWVVLRQALEPFRVPGPPRSAEDPQVLSYLADPLGTNVDITLEVLIASRDMRDKGTAPTLVSRGSFRDMFWTPAQMLAHHASNGCNMEVGDLLASGTVSGPTKESRGCLLERTWRGTEPITLGDGTERKFLADGDEVIMRGFCEREGHPRIGFGECRGVIMPASA